MTCCAGGPCQRRVTLPGGGWACRSLLERGSLAADRRPDASPAPQGPQKPAWEPAGDQQSGLIARAAGPRADDSHSCASPAQARRVAAIEGGRCPCCGGGLGASEYPTWRRCVACGCHHKTAVIAGMTYSEVFINPRCEARSQPAGMAGRRAS